MENKKPKPHDPFLKFLLDDTRKAKDFLRRMLPRRLVPAFETIFTSLYDMQDEQIARICQIWLRATLLTQKYSHKRT